MSKNNEFVVNKIQKAVKNNHRLFFVMEDAANIPYIYNCLKNNVDGCQPSVLWLYKKNKEAEIAQKIKTDVTFVNYGETDRILGNTHRMLILQDFEALTPNILARSVETVQGGGVIILVTSQIMDAEIEFEGDKRVFYRFNRRLYKTMKKNDSFLFFDKDMNVKHKRNTTEQASKKGDVYVHKDNAHIESTTERKEANYNEENVKKNKIDVSSVKERIGSELKEKLYNLAKTEEQKQITKFLESKLDEKNCKTIVSLTAGRGRGKSAAFGLTASLAVFQSFSSILIASPAIENIATLFDFIILGLHALGYKEKIDYEVVKKVSNKKKYVCKLIIHKNQKQIIEYQNPFVKLQKLPDLLLIDEAAAIPIPNIKSLLACNLVFLASTINGYEGTGRSLTYKLFNELRAMSKLKNPFVFDEIEMNVPIRYSENDPIEFWLNNVLLLNAKPQKIGFYPSLDDCELFCVNKDVLLSCSATTEAFLSNLVSLFVSSHYKNTPNDLLTMSDNEAHKIFVLTTTNKNSDGDNNKLPHILCAVQVAYEGVVNKANIRRDGNLISWTLYDNYLLDEFLALQGVRIVRIAVHPDLVRMGYGQHTVKLLNNFYNTINENENITQSLLISLSNIKNKFVDFIGSSFGTTEPLINFWKKNDFVPIYTKQTPSYVTGEHSTIVLRYKNIDYLHDIYKNKLFYLFSNFFKDFRPTLCLSLFYKHKPERDDENRNLDHMLTKYDKKRLEKYCTGECDIRIVSDLYSRLAHMYFIGNANCTLSIMQQCILLSLGCQNKEDSVIMNQLGIEKDKFYNVLHKTLLSLHLSLNK